MAFLPAYGREGAALLRIYNLASALEKIGWRCLILPPKLTLGQRQRVLAMAAPDVLVMQGVRHPLNRPAFYDVCPILFDMDDADFYLDHLEQALRRAMPAVSAVIAGSAYVADWCRRAGAGQAHVVWTGTPVSGRARTPHRQRPPVIAWAQTRPETYVREAKMVRALVSALSRRGVNATLRLYDFQPGDSAAFAETFRMPGISVEWAANLPYREYLASLDDVSLGLAPLAEQTPFSRGKSFGKVLAYLDRGVPVIGSDACEHGAFFTPDTGVITNDPDVWSDGAAALLADPEARQTMSERAFRTFRDRLSIEASASRVSRIMEDFT